MIGYPERAKIQRSWKDTGKKTPKIGWVLKYFCQNYQFCTTFLVEWGANITFGSTFTLFFRKFDQVPHKKTVKGSKWTSWEHFYIKTAIWGVSWLLKLTNGPLSWIRPWELCSEVCWRGSITQKIKFKGLNTQFNVKKSNFRRLIAKIGYLRAILTSKTHLRPIFMDYSIKLWFINVCWRDSRVQEVRF